MAGSSLGRSFGSLARSDLAQALATRACRPPGRSALAKLEAAERAAETTPPPPATLF